MPIVTGRGRRMGYEMTAAAFRQAGGKKALENASKAM